MGKGPKNGARSPVSSATFPIEAKFGSRRASSGGMGVFLCSIGCSSYTPQDRPFVGRSFDALIRSDRAKKMDFSGLGAA